MEGKIGLVHKNPEGTFLWWLLSLVPILNIYWIWRMCTLLAGHEPAYSAEGYSTLRHRSTDGAFLWFIYIFFMPAILGFIEGMLLSALSPSFTEVTYGFSIVIVVIGTVLIGILLAYPIWKISKLIAAHEKAVVGGKMTLVHKKEENTIIWFLLASVLAFLIIPLLYWNWKVSELIAGHEEGVIKE